MVASSSACSFAFTAGDPDSKAVANDNKLDVESNLRDNAVNCG